MTALSVSIDINGERVERAVEPRMTLADFLRGEMELTGTHLGCEMGVCGACLVLLDGKAVHSCLMFAAQADGAAVETIEGLTERGTLADLQKAFHERNALQCGFCTSGMLVSAYGMLAEKRELTREEIRDGLSGNYCRCTGYEAIVDAIEHTVRKRVATAQEA
jgi:carbon-monoxide dehydrogenase small subunit